MLTKAWKRWLAIATFIGNIQMAILLSLIYWTMVAATAIPMRFLSDPLTLRRHNQGWVKIEPVADVLDSMKKQG